MNERKLIFEISRPGRKGYSLPPLDVPVEKTDNLIPRELLRKEKPPLPEVAELDAVRHFTNLSQLNHSVDTGFYPLGSCTMKYNPKINEELSRLPGFLELHPYQPQETIQGALKVMHRLQQYLCEIGGVDKVTLQPAAGAHGELTGLMLIRAYLEQQGNTRSKVIIPDSAHGTNPATVNMCGYQAVEAKSDARGGIDLESLKALLDEEVAALMLTNPNTLGLYDENIDVICRLVHEAGGLLYYDGANANAIMGYSRPGEMGFDVVHFNLHKTFATPHGGGGPGAGPVGVKEKLAPFLPVPLVEYDGSQYYFNYDLPHSIGRVKAFYGNFNVMLKAYAYILSMGAEGLKKVSEDAVLNANYLMRALAKTFELPYDRDCMHEFVLSGKKQLKEHGIKTLDMAKRLLDEGIHPPTIYFPLIVEEAMMVEPTETETLETLDHFIKAMELIAREAADDPASLKDAPRHTPVGRLDEVRANRHPDIAWKLKGKES